MPNDKTLRDEFAMAALVGIVNAGFRTQYSSKELAQLAYRFADAMMKERSQEGGDGK